MKLPKDMKQAGKAQLRPSEIRADALVVTIATIEFRESSFRKTEQPVLTFEEFPENELRLGKRATAKLAEKFGDETDDWLGKEIPLVKKYEEVKQGNDKYVYTVPPVEEWAAIFKQSRKATRAGK